jgi:hypothetical protein
MLVFSFKKACGVSIPADIRMGSYVSFGGV